MTSKLMEVGRLAFRQEGANWNCYWARDQHSMDDALFLGSLSMRFAVVPTHKQAFMELMRSVFETAAKDAGFKSPTWKGSAPCAGKREERQRMIVRMISDCTRVCGKAQGFLGLPIRDIWRHDTSTGETVPAMQTSWEPTPKELEALNGGGSVVITIMGTVPPPMIVEVEDAQVVL